MAHRTGLLLIAVIVSALILSIHLNAQAAVSATPPGLTPVNATNTTTPSGTAADGTPQPIPDKTAAPLTILVLDQPRVLGPVGLSHLKSAAAAAAASSGVRFYIYIVRSVEGQLGEAAVAQKASAQNLSQGRDSILIMISVQEKQGWIWTSPQLDDTMGPGVKQAILDYIIEPNLQRGDIQRAAMDGTRALGMALSGAYKPKRYEMAETATIPGIPDGALPGLLIAAFVAMLGGGGAYGASRAFGGAVAAGPNILSRIV